MAPTRARTQRTARRNAGFFNLWSALLLSVGVGAAVMGAAFLVDGGVDLRTQSEQAVTEATKQGPPPLQILEAQAQVRAAGLYGVEMVAISTGGEDVHLAQLRLELEVDGVRHILRHGPLAGPASFKVTPVRDADGSLALDTVVLNGPDLAQLEWELDVDPASVRPGTRIQHSQLGEGLSGWSSLTLTIPSAAPTGSLVRLDLLP